jgi:hypothetical protein
MTPEQKKIWNDMCFHGLAVSKIQINENGVLEMVHIDLKDFKKKESEIENDNK